MVVISDGGLMAVFGGKTVVEGGRGGLSVVFSVGRVGGIPPMGSWLPVRVVDRSRPLAFRRIMETPEPEQFLSSRLDRVNNDSRSFGSGNRHTESCEV